MAIDKSNFPAIRGDISILHHPDTVASKWSTLDVDGTSGQVALNAGIAASKAVYVAQAEAIDVRRSLARHVKGEVERTTKGPVIKHGFEREYAQRVANVKDRVLKSFDAYHRQVLGSYDHLHGKVQGALKDSSTSRELQQEIRGYVRSLDGKERTRFLMSQPLQTVAAVLAAPAYLSGLDADQVELIKTNAQKRFAGVETDHLDKVNEVNVHLWKMREAFVKWADGEMTEANTPSARAVAKLKDFGK